MLCDVSSFFFSFISGALRVADSLFFSFLRIGSIRVTDIQHLEILLSLFSHSSQIIARLYGENSNVD